MDNRDEGFSKYFIMLCIYSVTIAVCITMAFLCLTSMILIVSKVLHESMISKVLNAPVNLYFDVTPSG
jgi:hypothetical protein